MDVDQIGALGQPAPITAILVTYRLNDEVTIRWTDGGFLVWEGNLYRAKTSYGVVSEIGEISDGIDGETTTCPITIMPASDEAFSALIAFGVQGAAVSIHFATVDFHTGLLIGEPELLLQSELDVPSLSGSGGNLVHETITEEARMLEVNDERRLTDSFHKDVWPLERGYENVTGLKVKIYWRASDPNNAISK